MTNLQDQGIFQKGGVFKIKGSLRRDEFEDQGIFQNQMMDLQDQGIFQKGGVFKIKGSFRREEFSRSKDL